MNVRLLQAAVALGCVVPLLAGGAGMALGPEMQHVDAVPDLDSHYRYLSGLLFAIGLGFASTIPRIATQGARFRLLTAIVVCGGLGRLVSLIAIGPAGTSMTAALVMELVVTPALALWQYRVAQNQ